QQDRPDLTQPERDAVVEDLRRGILGMWETEEIRLERPTPMDEVITGLYIFEQTLWDAVPRCLRLVDGALCRGPRRPLPVGAAPAGPRHPTDSRPARAAAAVCRVGRGDGPADRRRRQSGRYDSPRGGVRRVARAPRHPAARETPHGRARRDDACRGTRVVR